MTYSKLCQLHKKAGLPLPCLSCFELYQEMKLEQQDILPLRKGALDAISWRNNHKICKRCEKMEGIMKLTNMDIDLAFAPAYQDWGEAIRLPQGSMWGSTQYPTGGLKEWLEYQEKRNEIDFYKIIEVE